MKKSFRKLSSVSSGSLADIAFLLLIFFLVATTIDQEAGVKQTLPPIVGNPILNDLKMIEIKINKYDQILVDGNLTKLENVALALAPFSDDFSTPIKFDLACSENASYKVYLEVQSTILQFYQKVHNRVAFANHNTTFDALKFPEKKQIEKKFPKAISERVLLED